MPVYEYRCPACKKKSAVFFRSFSQVNDTSPTCSHCGGGGLIRLISRVARLRSGDDIAALDDLGSVDENDPRSMSRWLRRAGRELGDEAGPEFQEMVDRLESGEDQGSALDPYSTDDEDGDG